MAREFSGYDAEPRAKIVESYTSDNPFPKEYRAGLDDAGDQSRYSDLHRGLHRELRPWIAQSGVYDVLLVDAKGNVVYSVAKESDFGTNFVDGPLRETTAARTFLHVAANVPVGRTYLKDFEVYAPSGLPAAFMARRCSLTAANSLA